MAAPRASDGPPNLRRARDGWIRSALRRGGARMRTPWRRNATRRESFVKMLLTWRSTVRSLRTSSSAIALLVRPAATSRSTWSSRAVRPWASAAPVSGVEAGEVGRRSQLGEGAPGRLELERGRVVVAERLARLAHQRAHARGVVRRLDVLPHAPRLPQRGQRRARVARRRARPSRASVPRSPGARRRRCRRSTRASSSQALARGRRRRPRRASPRRRPAAGRRARPGRSSRPSTRRIVASAASVSPCASRSSARPGCGSRPCRLASRYAASASPNAPRSRWTSPCT